MENRQFLVKGRYLFVCLIGVIAAYLLGPLMPFKVVLSCMAVMVLVTVCVSILPVFSRKRYWVIFLISFCLAMGYYIGYHEMVYRPMASYQGQSLEISGRIDSGYSQNKQSKSCVINVDTITCNGITEKVHGKLLLYMPEQVIEHNIAATVSFSCEAFSAEEEQDSSLQYNKSRGIYLSAWTEDVSLVKDSNPLHIYRITAAIRSKLRSVYFSCLPKDAASFVVALTLGDTSYMDADILLDFRGAGVAHIMAVSGMHLSFIVALCFWILSVVRTPLAIKCVAMLAVIFSFTAITGFSNSCVRAAIMLSAYYIGILIRRESDSLTMLALAVVVCCIPSPYTIYSPGLLLSASSTLGIILLHTPISSKFPQLPQKRGFKRWAFQFTQNSLSMSISAALGVFPSMIFLFSSISLLSPIANLLLALPIQIVFYLAAALLVMSFCYYPLASVIGGVIMGLFSFCKHVVGLLASLPFSTVFTGTVRFWIYFGIVSMAIITLMILYRFRHRIRIGPSLSILLTAFILCGGIECFFNYYTKDIVSVYFVSAGQGDTSVVVQNHSAVIVDCGGSGNGYENVKWALRHGGVRHLEMIALTHMDNDHICYAESVISSYGVDHLVVPKREEYSDAGKRLLQTAHTMGATIHYIDEDCTIQTLQDVKMDVYTKQSAYAKSENHASLVYMMHYGENDILFPGDIGGDAEGWLAQYQQDFDCDILKVAHHGSKSSSSALFLQIANPEQAVISVGKNNSYDHPSEDVLERLTTVVDRIWRTDRDGTVLFRMNKEEYMVTAGV